MAMQCDGTTSRDERPGNNSSIIDNSKIFDNHAGDDVDNYGTEEILTTTSGTSEKSQDSFEDGEFLETIMSFSSTAKSLLKSYLKDSYKEIPSPSECVNDTARLVSSALSKEKWTIPFIDAAGKPGPSVTQGWLNFVGNLDQCKDASSPPPPRSRSNPKSIQNQGFKGKYCVFTLALVSNSRARPMFGVCVPDSCSDLELKSHSSQIIQNYKFDNSMTIISVKCLENDPKVKLTTIIAIILLVVVGGLVILGTMYDLICIQNSNSPSQNGYGISDNCSNALESSSTHSKARFRKSEATTSSHNDKSKLTVSSEKELQLQPFVPHFLLAFSAYTNGKKILCASTNSDAFGALSGIRFFSMAWVVLGHVFMSGPIWATNGLSWLSDSFDKWTFGPIYNAFNAVDTFFAVSGLLNSFFIIKEMNAKASWNINWPKYYFHRVWRLTTPYVAVLVIIQGLGQYLGNGSMWENDQPFDHEGCKNTWWKNLFYINNFENMMDSCMPHAWYLANDMQFYVITPLIIIPLFLYPIAGLVCCGALLVGCWINTGVLSINNSWVTLWFAKCNTEQEGLDWINHYYIKPWNRLGPYLIGILSGFVLHKIKGKSFKPKWWLVALGWVVSTVTALSLVYGVYGDASCKERSSKEVAALYNSVSRSIWGLVICWIVIACKFGYGGPVNTLLSWGPFHVLSRLTFMVYLLHPYVVTIFYNNLGQPFYMKDMTLVVYFLGIMIITMISAFVFILLFESPMIRLEKVLFERKKKTE